MMDEDAGIAVGRAVHARRRELGLTQERLAADAGISARTVGAVEHGSVLPNQGSQLAIENALGLVPGALAKAWSAASEGNAVHLEIDDAEDAMSVEGLHVRVAHLEQAVVALTARLNREPHEEVTALWLGDRDTVAEPEEEQMHRKTDNEKVLAALNASYAVRFPHSHAADTLDDYGETETRAMRDALAAAEDVDTRDGSAMPR